MFIVKESVQREFLVPSMSFFAVPAELDPKVMERIQKIQCDAADVAEYLAIAKTNPQAEVPACLDEPVVPEVASESKPVKKATAATSRKKSRNGSKKTEPKASATSQPKDE